MRPRVSKSVLLCIKKYQNSIKDTSSSDVSKRIKAFDAFSLLLLVQTEWMGTMRVDERVRAGGRGREDSTDYFFNPPSSIWSGWEVQVGGAMRVDGADAGR